MLGKKKSDNISKKTLWQRQQEKIKEQISSGEYYKKIKIKQEKQRQKALDKRKAEQEKLEQQKASGEYYEKIKIKQEKQRQKALDKRKAEQEKLEQQKASGEYYEIQKQKTEESIKKLEEKKKTPIIPDNTLGFAIPKYKRIQNKNVINSCKREFCELCGGYASGEPHHVITRGAGGPDMKENLIQLCKPCHQMVHSKNFDRDKLFAIIGRRIGKSVEEIKFSIQKVRGRI